MQEFYINVELRRGPTWIQVDEVPPEAWHMRGVPEFIIEYDTADGNELLTIQLESGAWYDQNTRPSAENTYLHYPEEAPDEYPNRDYQSPLTIDELREIGNAISRYMVVALSAYIEIFYPQFRNPSLN